MRFGSFPLVPLDPSGRELEAIKTTYKRWNSSIFIYDTEQQL